MPTFPLAKILKARLSSVSLYMLKTPLAESDVPTLQFLALLFVSLNLTYALPPEGALISNFLPTMYKSPLKAELPVPLTVNVPVAVILLAKVQVSSSKIF